MKAYNKIGFHTSVGGNAQGLGDWLRALDAADIPFFIKAADSMTGVYDAQQLIYARNGAVPHTLVFRRSIHAEEDYDVPDYEKEPEAAAEEHWRKHKAQFPKELDPKWVWIETINELRKEVEWADWIGNFAYYTGQLAMADGYKFSAFGYASGTPDEGAWETNGMLRYLEACQQHPDQLSVALHEYSFEVNDIWFQRGYHIGRFEQLFQTCDKHGIRRPKVLITEWGWTFDDVPDVSVAMKHIKEVAEYYGRFPEILGAAIWYLGPGFGGIANKAQKLIAPVTEFTLNTIFDVPDTAPAQQETPPPVSLPTQPPPGPMKPKTEPTPQKPKPEPTASTEPTAPPALPNGRFVTDITIPDDTRIPVGQAFTKTWRMENNGPLAWKPEYRAVFASGTLMADETSFPVPPLQPGHQADLSVAMSAPNTPGTYYSDWKLHDENRQPFGDIFYVRIVAEAAPQAVGGVNNGRFIADITVPDDTPIQPGQKFAKTWRIQNNGTHAWNANYRLVFEKGTSMTAVTMFQLPQAEPGKEVEISIPMVAPSTPGTYWGDWRLRDDKGNVFGEVIYVRIVARW